MLIAVQLPSDGFSLLLRTHSRLSSLGLLYLKPRSHNSNEAKRLISNPFDVIYGRTQPHGAGATTTPPIASDSLLRTASYTRIEQDLKAGMSPARASGVSAMANPPPVVTVIDDASSHNGSIVSRSASLRHRHSIRQRNKMVRRRDLDEASSALVFSVALVEKKKPKRRGLSFVFPIKRKTSFKYRPIDPRNSALKFNSQLDVDKYFVYNNVAAIMKDLLPRTMLTYNFTGVVKPEPTLHSHPAHFAISRASEFTMVLKRIRSQGTEPLLRGEMLARPAVGSNLDSSEPDSPSDTPLESRHTFIATVYSEYRSIVLAGKHNVPPRLDQVMPFEADIMSPEEREAIDTQLALEILLRRTLAAKIEYRLKKSGHLPSGSRLSSKKTSSSSDTSSHGSNTNTQRKNSTRNLGPRTPRQSSASTRENVKRNASIASDLLPSPQVSFASKAFDHDYHFTPPRILDPGRQKHTPQGNSLNSNQTMQTYRQTPRTHLTASSVYSEGSKSKGSPTKERTPKEVSPTFSNMFVNDFNKFYFESERQKEELKYQKSLSNLDLYAFKPLNRSSVTLSSFSNISGTIPSTSEQLSAFSNFVAKLEDADSTRPRGKRLSKSTAHTSLFHSLDNLANSVNEYLMAEGGSEYVVNNQMFTSTDKESNSVDSKSLSYSTQDASYKRSSPTISRSAQQLNGVRLNDMISIGAYSFDNLIPSFQREQDYDQILLGIRYPTSAKKAAQEIQPDSREITSVKGSFHEGYTETSISQGSPTSSMYSSIKPLKPVREHNFST